MKYLFLLLSACCIFNVKAQKINPAWVGHLSSYGNDQGQSITSDRWKNVICAGNYSGNIDLDPGSGVANPNSPGYQGAYLLKLDAQGNYLWSNTFGNNQTTKGLALSTDPSGNIYFAGIYSNTVDFDPGPDSTKLTSQGFRDIFLSKYDSSGNFLWAFSVGGPSEDDLSDMFLSSSGDIYICGVYRNTVDFDPGPGVTNLSSTTGYSPFIAKYNSAGNFIWVKEWKGSGNSSVLDLNEDSNGNLMACGFYSGTMDFDPGSGVHNQFSSGISDGFVLKLNPMGNFMWVKSLDPSCEAMAVDNSGNILLIGDFSGTRDLNPGPATSNFSAVAKDAFIIKLDSNADFQWAKVVSGSADQEFMDIAVDSMGNSYMSGIFQLNADFNPGPGNHYLSAAGYTKDAFIMSLSTSGNFNWAYNIMNGNGAYDNFSTAIGLDNYGNVLTTGYFSGTADTDPGSGTSNISAFGQWDAYVYKFNACNSFSEISVSSCSSYTSPSGVHTWNKDGVYYDHLPNAAGCDSIIKINLNMDRPGDTIIAMSCDSFSSPSGSYLWTSTGTYYDTLSTSAGCDSVLTINLQIDPTLNDTIMVDACKKYVSPGGNKIWRSSGTFKDTLTTLNGCDSILTINLNILQTDTSVTRLFASLQANSPTAGYQWLDCQNNFSILSGDTSRSFTPLTNGSYAVIVTENGCSDTSSCYAVMDVSNKEIYFSELRLYPNPVNDKIQLDLGSFYDKVEVKIFTPGGEVIYNERFSGSQQMEIPFSAAPGFYLLEVTTEDFQQKRIKLVKL